MTQPSPAQAFVERLFGATLGAMDLFAVYLGGQLGYYEALKSAKAPLTSRQLARKTGTNERYTREWLEQQAASEVLEVARPSDDGDKRTYRLPSYIAEVLTDESSMFYFAPMSDMFTSIVRQSPKLVRAYRTGGGVPWAAFGRELREAQAALNRPMFMNLLASEYLPSVPELHRRLSARSARVADIACGGGWSSIAMALGYPKVRVDGFDLDGPSIRLARRNAKSAGVADRVTFHEADAGKLSARVRYDVVTVFEAVHDMSQPVAALKTMRRLAGSNGAVLVMDERVGESFEAPANPIERLMYGASMSVCLPDGMSRKPSAGTGTVMRPSVLRGYAQAAGFKSVEVLPIEHDFFRFYRLVQ